VIRSMSSALSGLRTHQAMLDVVGNNIANVSTPGFKTSNVVFEDVLSQTLRGAGAPGETFAGTNAAQIGMGVRLVGTSQQMTQGALQRTSRTNDMAIQGDGFFVTELNGERFYTRAGNFAIDGDGRLATQSGALVYGWQADASGVLPPQDNTNLTSIQLQVGSQLAPSATTAVDVGGNLPALTGIGESHSSAVTVYDTAGKSAPLMVTFTKQSTGPDVWQVSATMDGGATNLPLSQSLFTFNAAGEMSTTPRSFTISAAALTTGGMSFAQDITVGFGDATSQGRLTQFAGSNSIAPLAQNGFSKGVLQSYTVSQDGAIVGYYSNGRNQNIGQVALAVFANPEGLERLGGNWRETPNSGLALVGQAMTGGRGQVNPGTLEQSNVDLPQEFTNLIVAQRGFQANSRVITTSDELLQEIVNLKR
jgi:flagellar hook protein FlgE